MRTRGLGLLALLVVATAGCKGTAPTDKLTLTGSSTVAPLIAEIGKQYEQETGTRVDVQTGGSSRGISDVRSGLADIGMISRALNDNESDVVSHVLARDGVTLIVHSDNAVAELSREQIVGVFTGQLTNWSQVGGADEPVTVVNKAEGRATLAVFLDYFGLASPQIKASVVVGDNEQGVKTVAGNRNAIGYVSIGTAQYDATHGVKIRLLPLEGRDASLDEVAAGDWPLSRPLNLVTKGHPTPSARAFIEYARSSHVREIVEEQYFVQASR